MDRGYWCSGVQVHSEERKPPFHNKKEDRPNRVSVLVHLLIAVCLQALLVLSPIAIAAQTIDGRDPQIGRKKILPTQSSYAVSLARLSIPAKAIKHLEAAKKRFNKWDLSGATREIDQALEIDPDCAEAFSMRAFVKLALKNFAGAIEDAHRAIALDPDDPVPSLALATAYNAAKEFSKAAEAAQQALSLNPNAWQGRLELAKSWYSQGQYALALNALDQINVDFPDVHLVRANALMCLGRAAEATEQFRIFLRQAPDDSRYEQIARIVAITGAP
jgi:tetratricopeptide (TPR) repeat protein